MPIVFFSYSHLDELLRDQIEKQLSMLKRQSVIDTWHDRRITVGDELDRSIDANLEAADIILLLVSADFLASDYCYDREMLRAMERHEAGEAIVIPIILRACDWHSAPFGKLMATPPDGKPITQWPDRDEAMLRVAQAIRKAAEGLAASPVTSGDTASESPRRHLDGPRSSKLRLARQFTEHDKDLFRDDAFEFIAKFFENSLSELQARNPGIEGRFRRLSANRFTASIYRGGKAIARCTIFLGGGYSNDGIAYIEGETDASNSSNETLSVHADDQSMFLRGMGMSHFRGRGEDDHLTMEGGAELYWGLLIAPLQSR